TKWLKRRGAGACAWFEFKQAMVKSGWISDFQSEAQRNLWWVGKAM
ncbi:hypothetical protein VCHENC02_2271B, partial [Vibrio harveyi]